MRDRRWLVILSAAAAACAGPAGFGAQSPMDNKQAHDLAQLVDRSKNLVFVGQARKVVQCNARGEKGAKGPFPTRL